MSDAAHSNTHEIEFEHGHTHHVTSMRLLNTILIILLIFTGLTVGASRIDLGGALNLYLAVSIAVFKAMLVCAVFMHLMYDKAMNSLILFFCVLTISFFLLFTLIDMSSRQMVDPIKAGPIAAPTIVQSARDAAIAEGRFDPTEHSDDANAQPAEH